MLEELTYDTNKSATFKRFIMFASSNYYPCGGFSDAIVTADTLAEVLSWQVSQEHFNYNEWHVFDCQTMTIIKDARC